MHYDKGNKHLDSSFIKQVHINSKPLHHDIYTYSNFFDRNLVSMNNFVDIIRNIFSII